MHQAFRRKFPDFQTIVPCRGALGIIFGLLLFPAGALAADAQCLNTGDTSWLLISSALVMLMLPGLALFNGGMVQKKNVLNSIMHSFVALGVIGVQWIIIGYSLSFGPGNAWIGDLSQLFLKGIEPETLSGSVPSYAFIMFQGMFAIITPALISGAIAERIKFSTYVVFIILWSFLVYDPVCHWIWGGGWLAKLGVIDFAGGLVVHLSSGISAFVLAYMLGRRIGFPSEMFIPHNLTITILGAGLLWFGWFGFNAGSALAANSSAALAFITTMTAAAAAACAWMIMEWLLLERPSALGMATGIIAGLATITPAAGYVKPEWGIVIGFAAGLICFYGVRLKFKFGYDDSLDVVGVHGIGGVIGPLATGIFATVGAKGLITGSFDQFWAQLIGVAAVGVYSLVVTLLLGLVLEKTMGLRVEGDEEINGLDKELHGEVGYTF